LHGVGGATIVRVLPLMKLYSTVSAIEQAVSSAIESDTSKVRLQVF
jgi:hypothetical protein